MCQVGQLIKLINVDNTATTLKAGLLLQQSKCTHKACTKHALAQSYLNTLTQPVAAHQEHYCKTCVPLLHYTLPKPLGIGPKRNQLPWSDALSHMLLAVIHVVEAPEGEVPHVLLVGQVVHYKAVLLLQRPRRRGKGVPTAMLHSLLMHTRNTGSSNQDGRTSNKDHGRVETWSRRCQGTHNCPLTCW